MDELILFSIPGLVLILTYVGIRWPDIATSTANQEPLVLALLTPLVGYVLHQAYRLPFEWTGGFGRKSRLAIRRIADQLGPRISMPVTSLDAFLVWEITLYDTKDFSDFRAHDAKSWHFLLAFWSTASASILACIWSLVEYALHGTQSLAIVASIQAVLAFLFLFRSRNLYKTINEQEVTFLRKNEAAFLRCMKQVMKKKAA